MHSTILCYTRGGQRNEALIRKQLGILRGKVGGMSRIFQEELGIAESIHVQGGVESRAACPTSWPRLLRPHMAYEVLPWFFSTDLLLPTRWCAAALLSSLLGRLGKEEWEQHPKPSTPEPAPTCEKGDPEIP